MRQRRTGFTLIELLMVVAIFGALFSLLLSAVQRVREAGNRAGCLNNLHQLGVALHHYHEERHSFPPGLVSSADNVCDAEATGFTYLLPYLDEDTTHQLYHFDVPWWQQENYAAVGKPIKLFFCPSNRNEGSMDLASIAVQWQLPLPPLAASCDYAFCKGANGALHHDRARTPLPVRGVFDVRKPGDGPLGVRLADIVDGLNMTIAMGEAAGGCESFLVRDLQDASRPAVDPLTGQPVMLEQSWSAAGVGDSSHPWYGSVFAVTAQYGLTPDPRDEPMNRRPGTPTVASGDPRGDNRAGKDFVSGFRGRHANGCNFLFCDGSARFVTQDIDPAVYRALSTHAGDDTVP